MVADIQFVHNHTTTIIDVAVACPSSLSYLATSCEEMLSDPNRACNRRAEDKRRSYESRCDPGVLNTLLPFTLDSTGRLSATSQAFLDKVTGLALANAQPNGTLAAARRRLLRSITTLCAKANAAAICKWRVFSPNITPRARRSQARRQDDI